MAKISSQPKKFAILAVDTALFTLRDNQLFVRLIAINRPPFFQQSKGLPGGLIDPKETADEACMRHCEAKACVVPQKIYIEQLYTYSTIDRDPRGRVVAVAYTALVPWNVLTPDEQKDTSEVWWASIVHASGVGKFAYDHNEILVDAIKRLRSRISYTTLVQKLLPKEFTLTELENAYGSILGTNLDKRNFRKKILKLSILKALPHKRVEGAFRPAQLYSFASSKVQDIEVL